MLNTIIEVDGVEYDVFEKFNFISRRLQTGKVESKDEEVDVPYRNGSLIVRASNQPVFKNRNVQVQLIHVGKNPREDSADFENLVLGKKCKVYIGEPSEIDKTATNRYYWEGYIEVGELKSSGLRWYKSFTVNAYPYRLAADLKRQPATATASGNSFTFKNEGAINVVPIFTTSATTAITVSDGTNSYSFSGAGEHKSANIIFEAGKSTILTFTAASNTNLTITWREGKF